MKRHKTREVFVPTKVRKENLSNTSQKLYPSSQVLGMSSFNPLNRRQPVAYSLLIMKFVIVMAVGEADGQAFNP